MATVQQKLNNLLLGCAVEAPAGTIWHLIAGLLKRSVRFRGITRGDSSDRLSGSQYLNPFLSVCVCVSVLVCITYWAPWSIWQIVGPSRRDCCMPEDADPDGALLEIAGIGISQKKYLKFEEK